MSCPSPSPAAPFNVAFASNLAEPVGEGSACVVGASFTNSAGAAFTPTSITYRVDNIDSGANIVPSTSVTPAASVSIKVTGAQNALLSTLLACEEHRLTLTVTDGSGNVVNAPISWQVQRIFPSLTE